MAPAFVAVPLVELHAEAVVQLDCEWVAEETAPWRTRPIDIDWVRHIASRMWTGLAFLVLLQANSETVVGYAWVDFIVDERDVWLDRRPTRKLAELHNIYCGAAYRGSGAGSVLWAAVEAAALAAGCTHIELTADSVHAEPLLRFYQQCGLSYMFARLRKELAAAPPRLAPLPFPFQSCAPADAATSSSRVYSEPVARGHGYADLNFASSFCLLSSPTLGRASFARLTCAPLCFLGNAIAHYLTGCGD